jgi:hypothetical protein
MGVEAVLEELTCDRAKERGWKHRKVSWVGRRGAPDHFFGKAGVGAFFVEFKKPKEQPTPIQRREIEFMRQCGLTVHVINSLEAAYALFD